MNQQISQLSLRGFTGILIGILALLAIYLVHFMTFDYGEGFVGTSNLPISFLEIAIIAVGTVMVIIALLVIWIRGRRGAKKQGVKLWHSLSKKQRFNTLIPILVFLMVLIITANKGYYSWVTSLLLSFYGLILLNLSKLASKSLLPLAILQIILGVLAFFIYDKELIFLALGFGFFHVIYGILTLGKKKKQQ